MVFVLTNTKRIFTQTETVARMNGKLCLEDEEVIFYHLFLSLFCCHENAVCDLKECLLFSTHQKPNHLHLQCIFLGVNSKAIICE